MTLTMNEEWKAVPCYKDRYEVSSFGRVRVSPDAPQTTGMTRGRLLNRQIGNAGYERVWLTRNGRTSAYYVHRLVASAFHGEPTPGQQVAHLDGGKLNNRADNLIWATSKENNAHKKLHGTAQCGERHPCAKMTEAGVRAARAMHSSGRDAYSLARLFGVHPSTMQDIVAGFIWKHVV
jgi:hypothetical protein